MASPNSPSVICCSGTVHANSEKAAVIAASTAGSAAWSFDPFEEHQRMDEVTKMGTDAVKLAAITRWQYREYESDKVGDDV
mmetsp:Transcript_82650/g.221607  ORF Transcript_82650/g.221607 Transcript_82650/m.221607 type:complete len:81 (-) Transcript_82650:795-1037(-)